MLSALKDRFIRSFRRYRGDHLEYVALRVVSRGLFLALVLMVVFLYVFTRATSLIAGQNEVLIPTTSVDPSIDLGDIVQSAFSQTSASVLSVIGFLTLVISSFLTARALRIGTRQALLGDPDASVPWRDPRTLAVAVAIPLLVLATWLLTFATSIRRSAWSTLLGAQLSDAAVDVSKAACVLLQVGLLLGASLVAYRLVTGQWPGRGGIAAFVLLAGVIVALNFFLLYTYVGALVNPRVSGGVVLVFTLLLWANIVVRAYLGTLCWIEVGSARRSG